MAAFWAVFTFGGSGPALPAHGSLDLKQEIQIQIQIKIFLKINFNHMITMNIYSNKQMNKVSLCFSGTLGFDALVSHSQSQSLFYHDVREPLDKPVGSRSLEI
jgi:hypothetical protein